MQPKRRLLIAHDVTVLVVCSTPPCYQLHLQTLKTAEAEERLVVARNDGQRGPKVSNAESELFLERGRSQSLQERHKSATMELADTITRLNSMKQERDAAVSEVRKLQGLVAALTSK